MATQSVRGGEVGEVEVGKVEVGGEVGEVRKVHKGRSELVGGLASHSLKVTLALGLLSLLNFFRFRFLCFPYEKEEKGKERSRTGHSRARLSPV